MNKKIKQKTKLKERLRNDDFDKIVIFKNGEWTNVSSNTIFRNSDDISSYIIRTQFYDVSNNDAIYRIKKEELILNGKDSLYLDSLSVRNKTGRKKIQEEWKKLK